MPIFEIISECVALGEFDDRSISGLLAIAQYLNNLDDSFLRLAGGRRVVENTGWLYVYAE